ncbi:MAG TPA: aspartate-semialdehyde dehydrogenase [Thermoplasmata archaeon]|nr:aspartate-semialdehyde dehydrogenase [Thermoplasmata archaeon]
MSERRYPSALLGASGYIGQHFARLLDEHPTFELEVLGAGERSAGRTLEDVWQLAEPAPPGLSEQRLDRATPGRLARAGVRVVFSALPSGTAAAFETELVRRGVHVFSNAADHRMDPQVPLLVPEVNADHLGLAARRPKGRGLLVTNPNCSAAGLVLGIAPLLSLLAPRSVHVTTYQSLSGAGYPGVPSLAITDNVVPLIAHEEEKIARESARMLGRRRGARVAPLPIPFVTQCARVATREGHLEAVTVQAARRPSLREILRRLGEYDPLAGRALATAPHPPLEVRPEADRPQPLRDRWAGRPTRARGMAVTVGRFRWEPPYLRFFLLVHNAVRGGAGGSILNAELADDGGWLAVSGGTGP